MNHTDISTAALFDSLVAAEIAVWNRLEHDLWQTPQAATLGRYLTLRIIATAQNNGAAGIRIQDIATSQRITVGAVSRLVDRLENDGLVTRNPHPGDRRATLLTLTEEGRARLGVSTRVFHSSLAQILDGFSKADIATLVPLLNRLTHAAETPSQHSAKTPSQIERRRGRQITKSTDPQ